MAALAINSVRDTCKFIFRTLHKIRKGIVATHAFQTNFSREACVKTIFETGRQIPFTFLCVESHWHLMKIASRVKNMGIGMLTASYYVIHFFGSLIYCIIALQTKLFNFKSVSIPERMIPEIG